MKTKKDIHYSEIFCLTFSKNEKEYYGSIAEKNLSNSKNFFKTVKLFLSDKILSKEQITLIERSKVLSEDSDVAQSLNPFLASIVTNHRILEYTANKSL